MIKNEQGLRVAKLFHVSIDNGKTTNSNKFYHMYEQTDGTVRCEWGRIGLSPKITIIQAYEFDKVYREKTSAKKGYKDQTELLYESITETPTNAPITDKGEVVEIACNYVRSLFNDLMSYAKKSVDANYKIKASDVTEAQIIKAQEIINNIALNVKIGADTKLLNNQLLELYSVITRKMKNVKDYLFNPINNKDVLEQALKLISNEQDTLDTMSSQVKLIKQQQESSNALQNKKNSKKINILDQMGLTIKHVTDIATLEKIKKMMGDNSRQFKEAYEVTNIKTQKDFEENLQKSKNKQTTLLWHGSRNENFFSILQSGLLIRPAGARFSGSAFGDGIYGASKSQKSIGYTSLSGSYWANGSDNKAFLAIFEFHTGKQYITYSSDSSLSSSKLKSLGEYDSTYAKPGNGGFLRNEEFIVYKPCQCTIKYLIEIKN